MNGLATFLAPMVGMPEVMGMAGRPPGTAEKSTDADGFLGILQQMISGSVQMASLVSMLPVLSAQGSEGEGGEAGQTPTPSGQPVIAAAESSVTTEQPGVPTLLSLSPPGPSPPGATEADVPPPTLTVSTPAVVERLVSSDQQVQVTTTDTQVQVPATAPETTKTDAVQPRSGGISLPVGVELVPEEVASHPSVEEVRLPAAPSGAADEKAPATEPARTVHQAKAAPPDPEPVAQVPGKQASAGKASVASLLRTGRQPDAELSLRESTHDDDAGGAAVPRQIERDIRTVRVPFVVAEAPAVVEREGDVKAQPVPLAEPVQTITETAEEEAPIPVKSDNAPAKAVPVAKPVFESTPHDAETPKNPFSTLQQQTASVKSTGARMELNSSRLFVDVPFTLPPETTRSVIDQVVKEAVLQVQGETSTMRITLVPASLGEVTLNVRMEGGQMQAQIDVSNASVKAVLEVNMGQLRDALSSRGIEVQRLDVHNSGQSPARDAGGNQGDRYRRQSGRRHSYAADAVEQYGTGRLMGYNTMEVIM